MFCFFDQATIPQPANWPNGTAWNANQHQIASVFYDYAQFGFADRAAFTGTPILVTVDETGLANQRICADLNSHQAIRDVFGLQKYYYRDDVPGVFQRNGWIPAPALYTPAPASDVQITFATSVERAAFDTNLTTELAVLDNILNTAPTTLAQSYVYEQQLARNVKRILVLLHRIFAPDS